MPENELTLLEKYQSGKDAAIREEIVLRYLPLVHFVLGRLGASKDMGMEYEDMASQGLLGLMDALERYDTQFGTQFSTYATIKIRGKVLDYMRSLDWLSRGARQRSKLVLDAINDFLAKNQRLPSDAEIAAELKLEVSAVQSALVDSSRVIVSLDSFDEMEGDEAVSLHETLEDANQSDPADMIDGEETHKHLMEAIKTLPEREQVLLSLYYYENLTFKEIGEVLGVSESRVCQLHARAAISLKTLLTHGNEEDGDDFAFFNGSSRAKGKNSILANLE